MGSLSGRITQADTEVKRYMLDYTAQLSVGETITLVTLGTITSLNTPPPPGGSPALVVNNIAIAAGALTAVFYVSGGLDNYQYEVQFLATTSAGQVFEDIVEVDVTEKGP